MRSIIPLFVFILSLCYMNSAAQYTVSATVKHTEASSSTGSINLQITGGTTPFSYTWNPGSVSTQDLTNVGVGTYTLNMADATPTSYSNTYNVGYKVYWTDLAGINRSGECLNLSNFETGWNNAISKNTLRSSTDGWSEVILKSTSAFYILGFTDSLSNIANTSGDVKAGAYIWGTSVYYIGSNVTLPQFAASIATNDVIRIERTGSVFKLKKNGTTTYTTTLSSSLNLKVKASIHSNTSSALTICNIGASFMDSTSTYFAGFVQDYAEINHCTPGQSNGSVTLTPVESGATHTYSWVPGNYTTAVVSGLSPGEYTVTLTDENSNVSRRVYSVYYKPGFTNLNAVTKTGECLSATTPVETGWSTTSSKISIKAGTDGWVEFQNRVSSGQTIAFGFADSLSPVRNSFADIKAGIYFQNGTIYYSTGGAISLIGYCLNKDFIRLERAGSVFKIKVNGVTTYTNTLSSSLNLKLKVCLYHNFSGSACNFGMNVSDSTGVNMKNYVLDVPVIKHCTAGSNDGSISLAPRTAGETHAYSWSLGSLTGGTVTGLSAGIYTVTITDASSNTSQYTYNLGYETNLTNLAGLVQSSDCFSMQTSPLAGWNNGFSTNILKPGVDGWAEVVTKTTTHYMIGFSDSASATVNTLNDVKMGAYVWNKELYRVRAGVSGLVAYYNPNDIIRIEREGSTFKLKQNGVTVYTTTVYSNKDLKIKVGKNNVSGGSFCDIGCSFNNGLNVTHTQTDENCGSLLTGSVVLSPSGGMPPYTYQWSNGATGNPVTTFTSGVYTATITDVYHDWTTKTVTITTCPSWKTNTVTVLRKMDNGELNKISSSTWEDSYLEGVKQFNFSDTSKWVSFIVNDTTSNFLFGFGNSLNDTMDVINPTSYKVQLVNRELIVTESDNDGFYNRVSVGNVSVNDKIKILFTKNGIQYFVNDNNVYTSKLFSDAVLKAEAHIYSSGTTIKNIRVSHN